MNLSRQLPDAFKYCSSLTTLDLSGNRFSGPIPSEICSWTPFLVNLDLSNNSFSGSIPAELGNCTYLNKLMLNNNKLSGNIPPEISRLTRLKVLSVANNNLSGKIPPFSGLSDFEYGGNRHLCGGPLAKCGWRWQKVSQVLANCIFYSLSRFLFPVISYLYCMVKMSTIPCLLS